MPQQSKPAPSSEMSPAMINYLILSCRTAASFSRRRALSADFLFPRRFVYNQRSVGSTHSSHGNLSQASITSGDVLSGDEVDVGPQQPAKISGSADAQGSHASAAVNSIAHQKRNTAYFELPALGRVVTLLQIKNLSDLTCLHTDVCIGFCNSSSWQSSESRCRRQRSVVCLVTHHGRNICDNSPMNNN